MKVSETTTDCGIKGLGRKHSIPSKKYTGQAKLNWGPASPEGRDPGGRGLCRVLP